MLGHFCLQNLVRGFLQEHLDPTIAEQNLTEGLLVESNLNLGRRHCMVNSTLVSPTNLTGGGGPFLSDPNPGSATSGVTQPYWTQPVQAGLNPCPG